MMSEEKIAETKSSLWAVANLVLAVILLIATLPILPYTWSLISSSESLARRQSQSGLFMGHDSLVLLSFLSSLSPSRGHISWHGQFAESCFVRSSRGTGTNTRFSTTGHARTSLRMREYKLERA